MKNKAIPASYASKGDLTRGDIGPLLVRMTLPMTWGILAIIGFQLADLYFISLLGTEALAAISFTMPVSMIVFSLILGLAIAMSSVISRQIGEGNQDRVVRITTHGLVLAFLFGVIIAVIGILTLEPLFSIMGAKADLMPYIRDYMLFWFAGAAFIAVPIVGNAAIRATGNTLFPAMVMSIVSIVNIILDPLLIFGLAGFPRLEIQGAAIATIIANFCAMCAGLYMLGIRKNMIRLRPFYFDKFPDSFKRLIYIALPAGITNTVQPIMNAVIIALLATYGAESVAAFGIVSRVEAFAFVVVMGIAGGMAPILGQNWGAGYYERVHKTLHKAFAFNIAWALFVAAFLAVFAREVAGLFSDDSTVIEIAAQYFWIVPITYALGNLVQGWASAFNAIGRPHRAAMMIIGKHIFLQIPLAYIGGSLYGPIGIFISIAFANVTLGLGLHIWNWRLCRRYESEARAP